MPPDTDHDMLITLNTKLNILCETQKVMTDKQDKFITALNLNCSNKHTAIDDILRGTLDKAYILKLLGVFISVLLIIFALAGNNRISIAENAKQIEQNANQIDDNAKQIDAISLMIRDIK